MTLVSSRNNPRVKAARKLLESAAAREQSRQSVLEGVHLCRAYLERIGDPALCIVGERASQLAEVAGIVAGLPSRAVLMVHDELIGQVSALQHGVALLFVIDLPGPLPPATPNADSVLVDRLQDPGNLGSILRSAAAFGFRQVLLSTHCVAAWSPKVLRAGMGAHFGLAIHENCDLKAWIKRSTTPIFATSSHAPGELFAQRFGAHGCAFVFGNEGQGVAEELLLLCTTVKIPQPGGEESLNVAAAAAICLFEVARQRAMSGLVRC